MSGLVTLRVTAPGQAHAALTALLDAAGALAQSTCDAGDAPVLEPPPGATPLWPLVRLDATFPAGQNLAPLIALLGARGFAVAGPVPVPACDWVRRTQRVPARRFGRRLWVAPPGARRVPAGAPVVRLTPGLGFGTGTHPTTALCLRWLDAHPPVGLRVLDYGCGSGILALAAARLGARSVWAVDVDAQARAAAAENAAANGLELWVGTPARPRGAFDVVLANIVLPVLAALAPRLRERLRPDGRLVLSGVLDSQLPPLRAAFSPWLAECVVRRRAGWVLLAGVRRD